MFEAFQGGFGQPFFCLCLSSLQLKEDSLRASLHLIAENYDHLQAGMQPLIYFSVSSNGVRTQFVKRFMVQKLSKLYTHTHIGKQ